MANLIAPRHKRQVEAQKVAMVYKHHAAVKSAAVADKSKVNQDIINKAGQLSIGTETDWGTAINCPGW